MTDLAMWELLNFGFWIIFLVIFLFTCAIVGGLLRRVDSLEATVKLLCERIDDLDGGLAEHALRRERAMAVGAVVPIGRKLN